VVVAARYTESGELDPDFGDGGIFTHDMRGSDFGHAGWTARTS
jgi:hypothetical protein